MLNWWSTTLVLLLLAGFTSWLVDRLDRQERATSIIEPHQPDSYMENFTRTQMNENGRLKNRLRADYIAHFPDDNSTELLRPYLEIYNANSEPWRVKAERGWVNANHEIILLYGKVHLWRDDAEEGRELEVITANLRVLPKTEYAETNDAATIVTPSSITHGTRMRANLRSKRLQLLSKVKGRYEVNPDH